MKQDEILIHKGRIYVLDLSELSKLVMNEMHNVPYAEHPRYQKTIAVVRGHYFFLGMKKDIVEYIPSCMEC